MSLNTRTPKKFNFSFETNGKLMALGVPILKHFRVYFINIIALNNKSIRRFVRFCPCSFDLILSQLALYIGHMARWSRGMILA